MLKLWGHRKAPNVAKVLWAIGELGLEYTLIETGGPHGGIDRPDYRAMNPNGRIPTLEDEGFILWESAAILRYLARREGADTLYPTSPRDAAIVDQWLDWQGAHLGQAVRDLVRLTIMSKNPVSPEQLALAGAVAQELFGMADAALGKAAFMAGEAFTLADIGVGIAYRRWSSLPVVRGMLPALEAWFARVSARPGFAAISA